MEEELNLVDEVGFYNIWVEPSYYRLVVDVRNDKDSFEDISGGTHNKVCSAIHCDPLASKYVPFFFFLISHCHPLLPFLY